MDERVGPEPWTWLIERRIEARKMPTQVVAEINAAGVDLSLPYYCQIESGVRRCARNPELLGAIADAVGVSVLDLHRSRPSRRPQNTPLDKETAAA